MPMYASGQISISSGSGTHLLPPMGTWLMLSTPPHRYTSAKPAIILVAPMAMESMPEEQKRFTVAPETESGKPAFRVSIRATFMPCSASGKAHPKITSSISAGSKPGVLATTALITSVPMCSGRVFLSMPRGALPTAVRTAPTITASRIILPP